MSRVLEQIKSRRSIRKYKPDGVPQELLNQIIEAGLYAASGKGQQSAIIIQVTNQELRNEIARMENMFLAATSLGLGSCWINRAKEEFDTQWGKDLLKSLGVEGEYEGIGHCALGYIDGDVPEVAPRRENRVFYIK